MWHGAPTRVPITSAREIAMISSRLSQYFDQRGVQYEVSEHRLSRSSAQTARVAHVPPRLVAKSVILEDDDGFVMAVIPANRCVMLGHLASLLGRHELHLSDESRIAAVFGDCDRGAVPPVGMAWGIETVVDEELEGHEVVYLEGGDHRRLLRMPGEQFAELMRAARHGRFSKSPLH
jgi:Ala-tRNA(Pro) deacylase